jgi:hypothetical protein
VVVFSLVIRARREGLRERVRAQGTFTPEALFVYAPPENIGLTLDVEG